MLQEAKFDIMENGYYRGTVKCAIDDEHEYEYNELIDIILFSRPSLKNRKGITVHQVPINGKLVKISIVVQSEEVIPSSSKHSPVSANVRKPLKCVKVR